MSSQRIRKTAEVSFTASYGSEDPDGARKDLAVHVSLSSNQIVKEPDCTIARQAGRPADRFHSLGRNKVEPARPVDPIACREYQTAETSELRPRGRWKGSYIQAGQHCQQPLLNSRALFICGCPSPEESVFVAPHHRGAVLTLPVRCIYIGASLLRSNSTDSARR